MTRLWPYPKAKNGSNGDGQLPSSWPSDSGAELVAVPAMGEPERYVSRPVRPVTQLAVRIGLWGAVVLGCVGGVMSLLRPPAGDREPVVVPAAGDNDLPAPVARRAEQVVEAWLTATEEDDNLLGTLFLDVPALQGIATSELRVGQAVAISGRQLQEDYWAVTVEVEVIESIPVTGENAEDPAAGEDGAAPVAPAAEEERTTTWFLDVPIVGQVDGGLVALTTPAVLPGRPEVVTGWRPSLNDPERPTSDDPTARTVDGFLDALLAGGGDPERYVAPGVAATAADPAPFADVEVGGLAVDQLREGEYRVLAEVAALTVGARGNGSAMS